jgi:prepilin-type N-terminal cleavage/methylation domain-containing protein/prepilin-type processing-associated H-X9-DG protein
MENHNIKIGLQTPFICDIFYRRQILSPIKIKHKEDIPMRLRTAFTLIELLVVIAIIAILASILFPVFAQTREKARQASCLSNTKQLSLAMMLYTEDYDTKMPLIRGSQSWVYQMQPYLKSYAILRCPSDTSTNWTSDPAAFSTAYRVTSYTLNSLLIPATPTTSNPNPISNPYDTITAIDKPASVIFMGESATGFRENYFHAHQWPARHWVASRNLPDDLNTERHSEGFTVGFLDGHAKWVRWNQVWWQDTSRGIARGNFDPLQ